MFTVFSHIYNKDYSTILLASTFLSDSQHFYFSSKIYDAFCFSLEGNGVSAAQEIEACKSNTFNWYKQTRI